MIRASILFSILSIGFSVQGADFEGVTEFESYNIRGRYTVTCVSGTVRRTTHFCRAHGMHPFHWARFTHQPKEKVTKVVLKATGKDGKTVKKSSQWDTELSQSFREMNLYVNGFFQTALLQEGDNNVEWELKNGNQVVESGNFNAHITRGNHLQCAPMKETGFDSSYCKDGMKACTRYFEKQTDCKPLESSNN